MLFLGVSFAIANVAEESSAMPEDIDETESHDSMREESLLPDSTIPSEKTENTNKEQKYDIFYLTEETFASNVSEGDWFIYFGVSWCKYCKKYSIYRFIMNSFIHRLNPKWEKLQKKIQGKPGVRVAKVDCTKNEKFCDQYGIEGYPTLLYYRNGRPFDEYEDDYSLKKMLKYLEKMGRPSREDL